MSADVLIVMPSVPAVPEDGGLWLDIKAVDGLALYAKLWPGRVRCLFRTGTRDQIAFGRRYSPANLPFEIALIGEGEAPAPQMLNGAAVVLAAGDSHHDFALIEAATAPVVFIIEYTLRTRLRIIVVDRGWSLRAFRAAVWTLLTERDRRFALRHAAGIQANGRPAYDTYASTSKSALLYFDSRMSDEQQINLPALQAKQAAVICDRPLRLAFSGRLERMKGANDLIDVAACLRASGIPFILDVFGDGALRQTMEVSIISKGLVDQVRLRGPVPFNTVLVPEMRDTVDLFLCCHRQDDPSCTYLETLSCGVPIVGYANAAFKGVLALGNVGVASAVDDPAAMARVIGRLHRDRPALANMMKTAAAVGRAHSFERGMADRIAHLRGIVERGLAS